MVIEPEQKLLEAAKPFLGEDGDILRVITPFADSLLVLPPTWEEVMNKLERSDLVDLVSPLVDWLPSQSGESLQESLSSFKSQRQLIKELAEKLVYAETAEIDNFLATIPLKKLASDHRRQLPITVVVGAKGSGKTYTFMQIVRRENWEKFVQKTGAEVQNNALIAPILSSKNLEDNAKKIVEDLQKKTAKKLKFDRPQYSNDIRDDIRKNLTQNLHEGQWRECWLDVMAWGVGFQPKQAGAGRELADHLFQEKQQLIVVIDGLEDLFQNFDNDENQQKALRALLQEVPEWLGQQPGRPLGIIIFVRRDIVLAAVRQNAAQMMARYQPYALKWNREEALRLVAWVTKKATSNFNINLDKLQDMSEEEITDTLVPLWGKKLGTEKSKEARSVQFVLAALSDFNGQIQSRDLVRFLKIAADKSMNDNRWQDRILIPKAIRDALPECSQRKIEEIEIENTALKNIFTKLRDLAEANRKIPFTREAAQLSIEEIKTLLDNGVVIQEEDDYYMPEIFRYGLNFGLTGRAPPPCFISGSPCRTKFLICPQDNDVFGNEKSVYFWIKAFMVMIAARDEARYFTPEEYFSWEEKQLEKHELIDGRVYAIAGGTRNHSDIAGNFLAIIKPHLRGSGCKTYNSDCRVNILNTRNYTYPDLSVTCDPRDNSSAQYITYPCLIVEVLSDSTEGYDRGKKFEKYRQNPNLVDYVLVSYDEIAVDIYHKNDGGEWVILSYREGDRVDLKSIDLSVAIEVFYEEVIFEPES